MVCLFPAETDLRDKTVIRTGDLHGKTIIQLRSFDTWTVSSELAFEAEPTVRPKNIIETYVTRTAAQLARSCRGYALVDLMSAQEVSDQSMVWRPFEGGEAFSVHLAYSSTKRRSAVAEKLMRLVREDAARLDNEFTQLVN